MKIIPSIRAIYAIILVALLAGCSSLTENMADNLAAAMRNNNDLETIKQGSPAYLIMIDALINGDDDNEELLKTAAGMYGTYAEVFVTDQTRKKAMTTKAFNYAQLACCNYDDDLCGLPALDLHSFTTLLASFDDEDDLPYLFTLGQTWISWVQSRRDDLSAIAQICKIEALMTRIIEIDEGYQDGAPHIYLGALAIFLPPSIGGRPEIAQKHFARAVELAGERNLMAKVIYADKYGRMMFDQQLHDRLLTEVLAAKPIVKDYTLSNILAQKRARELLASGQDYF